MTDHAELRKVAEGAKPTITGAWDQETWDRFIAAGSGPAALLAFLDEHVQLRSAARDAIADMESVRAATFTGAALDGAMTALYAALARDGAA